MGWIKTNGGIYIPIVFCPLTVKSKEGRKGEKRREKPKSVSKYVAEHSNDLLKIRHAKYLKVLCEALVSSKILMSKS